MNQLIRLTLDKLFGRLTAQANLTRHESIGVEEWVKTDEGDRVTFSLPEGGKGKLARFSITAEVVGQTVIFSLDSDTSGGTPAYYGFTSDNAVQISLGGEDPDAILAFYHQYTCWIQPQTCTKYSELGFRTQNFLAKFGDAHCHVLGLCGDNFRCEFHGGAIHLSVGTTGIRDLRGTFMAVTFSDDPFTAIKQNYENARTSGAIRIPLKREKKLSFIFDGLGWCTWDAFEQNVSEKLIFEKLDELKKKNVPIHWLLIDDGWMTSEKETLTSFKSDPVKFPNGLKSTIDTIKNDYGVEFVGVWTTFEAYWYGVLEGSELYEAQKDNLMRTPTRFHIPSLDEEKAYAFWNEWHTYLEECGVDFLKVDNQSSYSLMVEGIMPTAEACRIAHRAFERSVSEHFNGNVINCMGMDMENTLARPVSSISRSGEDFGCTEDIGGIRYLLLQNVRNTVWMDQLYYCDYDMWWSGKMYPYLTGALRAISGAPIYVSDGIGKTDAELLTHITEDDGEIMYCDHGAYPTLDCLYETPDATFKIWNRSGDAFAAAVYPLGDEAISGTLKLSSIPGIEEGRNYIAYEYFTGKYTLLKHDGEISYSLAPDKMAAYSIYPVYDWDGEDYIMQGNKGKVFPIASRHKFYTAVVDII